MDTRGILEHLAQHGTPAPGAARSIDVGSDLYLKFLEEEIFQGFIERGAASCRIYEGEYGAGKTHLLQLIAELAVSRGAAVIQMDLSEAMHLGDWRGLLQQVVQSIRVHDADGEAHVGLPRILADLAFNTDELNGLKTLRAPHTGFRDAIRYAAEASLPDSATSALERFLLGEPVTISYLRRSGVPAVRGVITDRNAERVLQTLALCLRSLGIPSIVVLFDETEHTLSDRPGRREIRAANLMRRVVDGVASGRLPGMFFGFAVLPGTIEQASLVYPALGQRISSFRLSFGGYRRPVLQVSRLSTCSNPTEFLDMAVARFSALATEIGVPPDDLPEKLRAAGRQVIESYASGYRRPLMKQLAMTVVTNV